MRRVSVIRSQSQPSLANDLGGTGRAVRVTGDHDVDTIKRLVAGHTLSVVERLADDHTRAKADFVNSGAGRRRCTRRLATVTTRSFSVTITLSSVGSRCGDGVSLVCAFHNIVEAYEDVEFIIDVDNPFESDVDSNVNSDSDSQSDSDPHSDPESDSDKGTDTLLRATDIILERSRGRSFKEISEEKELSRERIRQMIFKFYMFG